MNLCMRHKLSLFMVTVCHALLMPRHSTADVETLLAEINAKPAEERLKRLVDGARKEGVLYYYGATNLADIQELTRGFSKNYPFIDLRYTRLGGPSVVSKVVNEYRAGVF